MYVFTCRILILTLRGALIMALKRLLLGDVHSRGALPGMSDSQLLPTAS